MRDNYKALVDQMDYRGAFRGVLQWRLLLVPLATMTRSYVVENSYNRTTMTFLSIYIFGIRVARIHRPPSE